MKNRNVTVGLFVLSGFLLFGAGLFLIGDRRQAFGRHAEYFAEFLNLSGLSKGAKVRVGGMDAGEVLEIRVPDSPPQRFRVLWRIDAKLGGLVRADSVAAIDTQGVVGATFLSVRPGTSQAPRAAALSTIPSREPVELSELLNSGMGLLKDTQATLKEVGGKAGVTLDSLRSTVSNVNDIAVGLKQGRGAAGMLLRDDAFAAQVRRSVMTTSSNLEELVAGVKAGRGAAGMLLADEALPAQLRSVVQNVHQASAGLDHAARQADAMISDLNARQIPQQAGRAVESLTASAQQVQQIVADVGKPDRQGVTAGANIRESLANANAATVNLADATEALKHNFLVRGFFRSRGYYNLDRLSPEQYRRDAVFTSSTNYRAWLPAAELFQQGPDTQEELSAAGKALLNAALTEYGDSVVASPIVVEGYCGGAPADQLRISRARALLVRHFIQGHFQLEPGNLGIVAMKTAPPNGVGRTSWDGICIVVLRKKK